MRYFLIAAIALFNTPALSIEFRCDVKAKYSCEPSGCKPSPIEVWTTIDFERRIISRCDSRGCDEYKANFSQAGDYINIDVPGRGMIVKVARATNEFMEIVTLGTTSLTSYGGCARKH